MARMPAASACKQGIQHLSWIQNPSGPLYHPLKEGLHSFPICYFLRAAGCYSSSLQQRWKSTKLPPREIRQVMFIEWYLGSHTDQNPGILWNFLGPDSLGTGAGSRRRTCSLAGLSLRRCMRVLSIFDAEATTSSSLAARISSSAASRLSATRCRIATRFCAPPQAHSLVLHRKQRARELPPPPDSDHARGCVASGRRDPRGPTA